LTADAESRQLKESIRQYWNSEACGERYAVGSTDDLRLHSHRETRYRLEPVIEGFARFDGTDKDVIEIGVGMGADHERWARSRPASLIGVDITPRAIEWTRTRLTRAGLASHLLLGDAERLPFQASSFDLVYSWGVLHHTPNTKAALKEAHRILRKGGRARLMIYHRKSIVGFLLWIRYGLLNGRPRRRLEDIYATHLESPGTQAFDLAEVRRMLEDFSDVSIQVHLGTGDLLLGQVGIRHGGALLRMARHIWPRWLLRRFLSGFGLEMLIVATK
jgi:ubiquinone/menaquinone biosynthesis C-methylase UbiE